MIARLHLPPSVTKISVDSLNTSGSRLLNSTITIDSAEHFSNQMFNVHLHG